MIKYNHKNFMEILSFLTLSVMSAGALIGLGFLKKEGYVDEGDNAPAIVVGGLISTFQAIASKIFRVKQGD